MQEIPAETDVGAAELEDSLGSSPWREAKKVLHSSSIMKRGQKGTKAKLLNEIILTRGVKDSDFTGMAAINTNYFFTLNISQIGIAGVPS